MNAMVPLRIAGAALAFTVALAACNGGTQAPETVDAVDIATFTVSAATDADGRAWDGVVEAVREARLSAQTAGRVLAVERDVNDRVAAGDVLVRLSEVEQRAGADTARAQLRSAEATLAEAETMQRRYHELAARQFVSKAQLDQVTTTLDAARAARDAARAALAQAAQQTDYTTVRAPYAGLVAARAVEPGESIASGQWLMTVFSPDALRVEVSVPQAQAEAVRARAQARLVFDDGRRVDAAGVTVFPSADPSTHSVKVRVDLPPMPMPVPMPGTTVRVAFPALDGEAFVRIPMSALVQRGEVSAVYVLAEGRLSLRQVRLGNRGEGDVEVIAGLRPGEHVAVDPVAATQILVARRGGD